MSYFSLVVITKQLDSFTGTQEEAARIYDITTIEYRGINTVINFDLSTYIRWLKPWTSIVESPAQDIVKPYIDIPALSSPFFTREEEPVSYGLKGKAFSMDDL